MKEQELTVFVDDAAKAMQTTPLHVLMHIKRGLLQGREEEGRWLIERASLDALLADTGGGRVSGVCASGCAKKHACSGGCG